MKCFFFCGGRTKPEARTPERQKAAELHNVSVGANWDVADLQTRAGMSNICSHTYVRRSNSCGLNMSRSIFRASKYVMEKEWHVKQLSVNEIIQDDNAFDCATYRGKSFSLLSSLNHFKGLF